MWISKRELVRRNEKQGEMIIELMKRINDIEISSNRKYYNLLEHLELAEWNEQPKDAIPAKTILITKKEQKRRNKNKEYSYPNSPQLANLPKDFWTAYANSYQRQQQYQSTLNTKLY